MATDSKMCPQCGGELRYRPQDNMFRCIVCKYEEKAKKSDFSISEYNAIGLDYYSDELHFNSIELTVDREHNSKKKQFLKWLKESDDKSPSTIRNYEKCLALVRNFYLEDEGKNLYDICDIYLLSDIFDEYISEYFSDSEESYLTEVKDCLNAYLEFLEFYYDETSPETYSDAPYFIPKESTDEPLNDLRKIGFSAFVKYYKYFENLNYTVPEIITIMASQESYTRNTLNTKAHIGRKIITDGNGIRALELITRAKRLRSEVTKAAQLYIKNSK